MAISINWGTRVISVPKADLSIIQLAPTEIRGLDIDAFRLSLKNAEDSDEGMVYPDTHRHNTTVLLGGVTYARVVEVINGYTVTFEDGQYAVVLTGANSNIADVTNVNQVSVRSSNSAGLVVTDGGAGGGGLTATEHNLLVSAEAKAGTIPSADHNLLVATEAAAIAAGTSVNAVGDLIGARQVNEPSQALRWPASFDEILAWVAMLASAKQTMDGATGEGEVVDSHGDTIARRTDDKAGEKYTKGTWQ